MGGRRCLLRFAVPLSNHSRRYTHRCMHLPEFIAKWKHSTLTERSAAQSWFLDLCRVVGVDAPTDVDREGTFYTFERGATKTSGKDGWADVWKKGCFAWEFKGKHANLTKAYEQLARY